MPARYRFRASAIGAGGRITAPFNEIIEVQAASSLPTIGGYGTARIGSFRHREILRFDLAYTEVIGREHTGTDKHGRTGRVFSTQAKATVEGLNIGDILTADRIVANLVSTYAEGAPEPSVRLTGSYFQGLRIAGIPITVVLNVNTLDQHDTYSGLFGAYPHVNGVKTFFDKEASQGMVPSEGFLGASIVRELKHDCEDSGVLFLPDGHSTYIQGFGTIRLGEVGISRLTRDLTMVEVDLGCPTEGSIVTNAVGDGGTDW